jgi:hypothetical protein
MAMASRYRMVELAAFRFTARDTDCDNIPELEVGGGWNNFHKCSLVSDQI